MITKDRGADGPFVIRNVRVSRITDFPFVEVEAPGRCTARDACLGGRDFPLIRRYTEHPMGLDDVDRFALGLSLMTLLGPMLALALACPRRGALAPVSWVLSGVIGGLSFVLHMELVLDAYQTQERIVSALGLALCVATVARWGAVTSALATRSSALSSALSRSVLLLVVWATLTLGAWLAMA